MVTLHHMCDKNDVASMDCAVFLLHVHVIDTKQLSLYCDAVNSVKLCQFRGSKKHHWKWIKFVHFIYWCCFCPAYAYIHVVTILPSANSQTLWNTEWGLLLSKL